MRRFSFVVILGLSGAAVAAAEVKSGPEKGSPLPALPVAAVTGEFAGQSLDYPAKREGKPTIYVIVPADKWSRPTARLLKKLDTDVGTVSTDAVVVGVWLTADMEKTKEYLPKARQALQLEHTALTAYEGQATGPADWKLDNEADVTLVVARDAKVVASFGFDAPEESLADGVIEALKVSDP